MNEHKAKEELAFIKKVMEDSQRIFLDNGKINIMWTIFIVVGFAIKYTPAAFGIQFDNIWIWIPIIAIGWLCSIIIKRKTYSQTYAETFAGRIFNALYTSIVIGIIIVVVVGYLSESISGWAIAPVVSAMIGSGYFISGIVSSNSWIHYTAFGWWAGAIVMFIWPGEYATVLLFLMFIVFYFIPGIMLYRKWKRGMITENR